MSNEKKTATLSIVLSITNNCRLRFGMNLTSFNILSSLKVLSTLSPELPSLAPRNVWPNSTTL